MDRTGGMENAHDTLAPECTGPEARFPHRLGRHRTPPIRSTGTLVCTLEHDVTGRISSTRCETDGRKLTEQRRYAPTSVHVRRNPCSRSPDLVFTFTGLRSRSGGSRSPRAGELPHRRLAVRTLGSVLAAPHAPSVVGVISTAVSTVDSARRDLDSRFDLMSRIRTGSRRGVFGDREHASNVQPVGAVLSLQRAPEAVALGVHRSTEGPVRAALRRRLRLGSAASRARSR